MKRKKRYLIADMGTLFNHKFVKSGYAMKAQSAVIEYGFVELGAQEAGENGPFTGGMRRTGLEMIEEAGSSGGNVEVKVLYRFEREEWGVAKKEMKESGRWYGLVD